MAQTASTMNAICSQILTQQDLETDKELSVQIQAQKIVTRITLHETSAVTRIYSQYQLYLSDITPILHDFGFVIIDEVTYILEEDGNNIHVCRFNLQGPDVSKLAHAQSNIESVISDALLGNIFHQCKIFSLVYMQNLSIRQVSLLRAFIEYINQAVLSINYETLLQTLTTYDELSRLFLHYFVTKFDPKITKRNSRLSEIETLIEEAIKVVPHIMDDRILKLTYALLKSLTRTNYFFHQESIAFKIDTATFSENLKGMQPRIEAFVYHPEFSGIHLRMSRISRGGLRWSERHDDYRTEVKSLMITQEGKNSIIIPDGAKGGFVINKTKDEISKAYFTEVYSAFINALLDLVDNRQGETIIRDDRIVAYDEDDDYFVVAADKGTASMSDIANAISIKRGFWLGDAFASGGSNGYGHKELGITAKGSLKSSERFFIEKGVDFRKESITVVGIGSMNGDVFGNGMLESKTFKLLGAISHKEIFIDPDPIPIVAFEERQRLFVAKNGSWGSYNSSLISPGGGVFLRSDKAITLSSQIQTMLGTSKTVLSGESLAKMLLTLRVDLLFNGGVGTYVKSSDESDLDLGDKQNEAVRIDASELRCDVVCEGGNLGFTQRARIEYALYGGKINVDGIDNAAGVNISDHEVNLKILLNMIEDKGVLPPDERDKILASLTDQVVNMVLWNNYSQALAISRDEQLSRRYLDDFLVAIDLLSEHIDAFNRRDFFIPKNENIDNIITVKESIVRPVLASLLSYSKIFIKKFLIESTFIDETLSLQYLYKYFPKSFVSVYEQEINHHPLRREIIATVMADILINLQGTTFISDYQRMGKERFLMKIKSYLVSNELFGTNDIRHEIYRNDYNLDINVQYQLLHEIEHTLNFSTRWMVRYLDHHQVDDTHILNYKEELLSLLERINGKKVVNLLEGETEFNRFFSVLDYLRFSVAAIMIKENSQHSFENVAILFYLVINEFKVIPLINALNSIAINSEHELVLRRQLMQFIEFLVVHYTKKILNFQRLDETPQEVFDSYIKNEKAVFDEIMKQIDAFMAKEVKDMNAITITVNQLMVFAI